MELIIGMIIVAGIIVFFVNKGNKSKSQALYTTYRRALAAKDKAAALNAGRAYYAFKRGGKLTLYDEQAIANDLSVL